MIRASPIALIAVLLCLGLILAPALPAEAEDVNVPKIPIIGPAYACVIEVGKVCASPVTHLVDQAYNRQYKGYPFSVVVAIANGTVRGCVDLYQGLAPWEWVMNKDLYLPPNTTVYNGPDPIPLLR